MSCSKVCCFGPIKGGCGVHEKKRTRGHWYLRETGVPTRETGLDYEPSSDIIRVHRHVIPSSGHTVQASCGAGRGCVVRISVPRSIIKRWTQ